jgi:hypothetical protein
MISETKMKVGLWFGLWFLLLFPSHARGYDEMAVTNAGTVRGLVRVQDKAPKPLFLEVIKFKNVCKTVGKSE